MLLSVECARSLGFIFKIKIFNKALLSHLPAPPPKSVIEVGLVPGLSFPGGGMSGTGGSAEGFTPAPSPGAAGAQPPVCFDLTGGLVPRTSAVFFQK